MATTPPKKKGRLGGKRVWVAVGIVALVVVAYVWYQNRSSSSLSGTGPLSTGSPTDQTPTGSTDTSGSGGLSGSPDDSTSSVLSALAGENQDLLDSLLASNQGLISLAGSSLGSPNTTTGKSTSPEVVNAQTRTVTDASGVGSGGVAPSVFDTLAPTTASTPVVNYNPGPSAGSVPSSPGETEQQAIANAAAAVSGTYGGTATKPPSPPPPNQGNEPRSGGTSSSGKRGVISVH